MNILTLNQSLNGKLIVLVRDAHESLSFTLPRSWVTFCEPSSRGHFKLTARFELSSFSSGKIYDDLLIQAKKQVVMLQGPDTVFFKTEPTPGQISKQAVLQLLDKALHLTTRNKSS